MMLSKCIMALWVLPMVVNPVKDSIPKCKETWKSMCPSGHWFLFGQMTKMYVVSVAFELCVRCWDCLRSEILPKGQWVSKSSTATTSLICYQRDDHISYLSKIQTSLFSLLSPERSFPFPLEQDLLT